MEITREYEGNVVIVKIDGDVSIFYKDAVEAVLTEELENGHHFFIFDFENVSYIDSVGISFLIQAGNISFENGKRVAVIHANPKVSYVVELARLDRIIGLFESKEDALKEIQAS